MAWIWESEHSMIGTLKSIMCVSTAEKGRAYFREDTVLYKYDINYPIKNYRPRRLKQLG